MELRKGIVVKHFKGTTHVKQALTEDHGGAELPGYSTWSSILNNGTLRHQMTRLPKEAEKEPRIYVSREGAILRWPLYTHYHATWPAHLNLRKTHQYGGAAEGAHRELQRRE